MLSNDFPVQPDLHGDPVQQYAAKILAIDPHVTVPHDVREARRLLAKLEAHNDRPMAAPVLRLAQFHQLWNAMLPQLAKAKRCGVRSRDTKLPEFPQGGDVSPDALRELQDFAQEIDIDLEEWGRHTEDQRRIKRLEAKLALIVEHSNKLVTANLDHARRIKQLKSMIRWAQ